MCAVHRTCTREHTCTAADSHTPAQRIPLDGTSTQILPFERTQISDKSRTNRHSRNGLLGKHIKAVRAMSNVPARLPPGNTRLTRREKCRADGDAVKMGFRSPACSLAGSLAQLSEHAAALLSSHERTEIRINNRDWFNWGITDLARRKLSSIGLRLDVAPFALSARAIFHKFNTRLILG